MIINSKQLPKVYFGLHFVPGVAEYSDNKGDPYRIFLNEDTMRDMDATFQGKPLYVHHVEEVDLKNIQEDADGYVIRSFFNAADSCHWAEFIAVSDAAIEAIEKKHWALSNAYVPEKFSNGGQWHGVSYVKEVTKATFEHLALVPNPRYSESIILTPEEFKKYNTDKLAKLDKISNSKNIKEKGMLNFFKKQIVETDLSDVSVTLKSGKEITISKLINDAEEAEVKKEIPEVKKDAVEPETKEEAKKEEIMAEPHHMVNVGEEKISVEELVKKHDCMKQELEDLKHPKKDDDTKEPEVKEEPSKELEKAAETKKNYFDAIKNAELNINKKVTVLNLADSQVAKGKSRYGSN